MSDALIIAVLASLTAAIGHVWRDNIQRLKEQAKEIKALQQANIALHAENAECQALYSALYFELYGAEPGEQEPSPERPGTRRDRRRRAVDRRRVREENAAADAATAAEDRQQPDWLP